MGSVEPDFSYDRAREREEMAGLDNVARYRDEGAQFVFDGLGVGSLAEARKLIERGRLISDATMAQFEELGRDVRGLSLPTGEILNPDVVLGRCPHGADLDRAFCPEGCRV